MTKMTSQFLNDGQIFKPVIAGLGTQLKSKHCYENDTILN